MNIQKQIKDNSRDVSEYFSDLVKWEEDQNNKEVRRKAKEQGIRPDTVKKAVPPPRGSDDQDDGENDPIARDKLPMPQYYHNWDQFDPEEEVDKLDEIAEGENRQKKEERKAEQNRILDEMAWNGDGDRVRTTKARPRVKVSVRAKGRRPAPVDLARPKKEEANNYFAAGRFKEAMVCYSVALEYLEKYEPPPLPGETSAEAPAETADDASATATKEGAGQETEAIELKVTLLANRAQALIKIEEWREAAEDCCEALRFDPNHHKSILRRGFALAKMKRWGLAARDLEQAVANDPADRKAAAELSMVRRNLAEQAKEVRAHAKAIICDTTRQSSMPTRKLTVKVRHKGDAFLSTPAEGSSATPAAEAPAAFAPQPRVGGARGEARAVVDLEAEGPPVAASASASASEPAPRTKQPYVPRSVRIRGRQPVPEESNISEEPSSAAPSRDPAVNFYSFEAQWTRNRNKPRDRAAQLRRIGAAALPALFRESLDAELVGSIISVLSTELKGEALDAAAFASSVMGSLSRTQRFEATLDALSTEEREVCQEVLASLEDQAGECTEDLGALRHAFAPKQPLPRLADEDEEEEEDEDDVDPAVYAAKQTPVAQTWQEDAAANLMVESEPVTGMATFSLDGCD